MKKVLIAVGVFFVILIAALIVIPLLFEDQIAIAVKNQANKNLNARVDFEDVSLSLFEDFPDVTLNLDNLTVINKAPFEGDTLLSMEQFEATVNIWSLIAGDQIVVEKIAFQRPNVFVYVNKDSIANYDIAKAEVNQDDTLEVETSEGEMNLALKEYSVTEANIVYVDEISDMIVTMKNFSHSGSGDFTKGDFNLDTETEIKELTFENAGVTYLNKANLFFDMLLNANMPQQKFTLKENELKLNNLIVNFDGFVQMQDSNMVMDLKFGSPKNDFKDIISLIPAIYSQDFEGLEASGKMSLEGFVKGLYADNRLPTFDIKLKVDNGRFQYPKLPTPVNNVNMDMAINNPGGSPDATVIDMKNLHLELGNEPIDANLKVTTPESNPYIDTKVKGRIDLAKLKDAVQLEGVTKLTGLINADFSAKGSLADVENNKPEKFYADGIVEISNMHYAAEDLPEEVNIKSGKLNLTPQNFNLSNFAMNLGKSDLKAEGNLNNVISYVLSNADLIGDLKVTSNYFNLNPYMETSEDKAKTSDTSKVEAVRIPGNIRFTMNSNFKKLIYDNLTLENVNGKIVVADSKVNMNSLEMNLLGGSLIADGYYYAPPEGETELSFNLNITDFDIGNAFESFVTVQKFAPMAKYINGKFSAKLNMLTPLDSEMMPIWNSFDSKGNFTINSAQVKDFKPFNQLADKLSIDALKDPTLKKINPSFKITDGKFIIEPFDLNFGNYEASLGGSTSIDKSIEYIMGFEIPAENLKKQANSAITGLLGKDVDLIGSGKIEIDAIIKGTIENPKLTTSASDIVQQQTEQVKNEIKQEVNQQIQEQKQEVQNQAQQQIDTVKEQLKEKAKDKLKGLFNRP